MRDNVIRKDGWRPDHPDNLPRSGAATPFTRNKFSLHSPSIFGPATKPRRPITAGETGAESRSPIPRRLHALTGGQHGNGACRKRSAAQSRFVGGRLLPLALGAWGWLRVG